MAKLEFDIQIPNIVPMFVGNSKKGGKGVFQMWSVKENDHLVHLKEVTDLGTNYK
jgi:hypothetical protein